MAVGTKMAISNQEIECNLLSKVKYSAVGSQKWLLAIRKHCAIFSSKVKHAAVGTRMAISNRKHCAIFIEILRQ